jgi:hypothetical protein
MIILYQRGSISAFLHCRNSLFTCDFAVFAALLKTKAVQIQDIFLCGKNKLQHNPIQLTMMTSSMYMNVSLYKAVGGVTSREKVKLLRIRSIFRTGSL